MSTIIVRENGKKRVFDHDGSGDLLAFLGAHGYVLNAPCGGNGTCGKCRVTLRCGGETKTVLACRTPADRDCEILLGPEAADLSWNDASAAVSAEGGRKGLGAAVDLGTTTVAVSLFDLSDGRCLGTLSEWNAQKNRGADVITRIGWCMEHPDGLEQLGTAVRTQILSMVKTLAEKNGAALRGVKEIFLAGNTVMQHIFAGIAPDSIAAAPYLPQSYFDDPRPFLLDGIPVFLAPCMAGYVGGDISAGILDTGLARGKKRTLFIDVGTNGEMAIGNRDGILCTSTAAGPAFEGGNISCGMGSVPGAICSVTIEEEKASIQTIGNDAPCGLCGTGVIETTAELVRTELVDETGRLEEPYFEEGFPLSSDPNGNPILFTQKDVREIQLAKAAVRAGLETLLLRAGISYRDVGAVYLAGGFGYRIDKDKAATIGMLPEELLEKTSAIGNSSLAGASAVLCEEAKLLHAVEIAKSAKEIPLSTDKDFNRLYMESMYFGEE